MRAWAGVAAFLLLFVGTAASAFAVLPVPAAQHTFSYVAPVDPLKSSEPQLAQPLGIGSFASGGTSLNIRVGLEAFSGPVDLYIAVNAPAISSEIVLITATGTQPLSAGLAKWKENTTAGVDASLFGDVAVNALPNGKYDLYLLATPAGNLSFFYLWKPSFVIPRAANVDNRVQLTFSPPVLNPDTGAYDVFATLTNTSTEALYAPLRIAVTGLAPAGVTLDNLRGQTAEGSPFVLVPVSGKGLAPGASIGSLLLRFDNPAGGPFSFKTSVTAALGAHFRPLVS